MGARLLLVDDHAIVRRGVAALLAGEGEDWEVAGEAGEYEEALEAAERLKPDGILLDLSLKDRSGLDWIAEARARGVAGKILVLSMYDEGTFAEKARARGADGYVMKDRAEEELTGALREVLAGGTHWKEGAGKDESPEGDGAGGGDEFGALTGREAEILYAVGAGLTTKEIAEKFHLSARTVDVHRLNIKRKLGCGTFADVLAKAMAYKRREDEAGRLPALGSPGE